MEEKKLINGDWRLATCGNCYIQVDKYTGAERAVCSGLSEIDARVVGIEGDKAGE